jgi:YhcG PDDEXK nuclease domain
MNFYLAALDNLLHHPDDKPSIDLIICKTKDQIVAEYALRNARTPIGISEYKLSESLPADLKGSLPTIEELES